jgi:hypothetical protein
MRTGKCEIQRSKNGATSEKSPRSGNGRQPVSNSDKSVGWPPVIPPFLSLDDLDGLVVRLRGQLIPDQAQPARTWWRRVVLAHEG